MSPLFFSAKPMVWAQVSSSSSGAPSAISALAQSMLSAMDGFLSTLSLARQVARAAAYLRASASSMPGSLARRMRTSLSTSG